MLLILILLVILKKANLTREFNFNVEFSKLSEAFKFNANSNVKNSDNMETQFITVN